MVLQYVFINYEKQSHNPKPKIPVHVITVFDLGRSFGKLMVTTTQISLFFLKYDLCRCFLHKNVLLYEHS